MKSMRIFGVLALLVITALMLGSTGEGTYMANMIPIPPTPTINYPTGNIRARLPQYSWSAVPGATNYQLQVKLGSNIVYTEDVDASNCDATECTFYPLTVLGYQTYNWQVRAAYNNGGSWSGWSSPEVFRILEPFLRMPADVIVDQTPRFVWTKEFSADSYKISGGTGHQRGVFTDHIEPDLRNDKLPLQFNGRTASWEL